MATAQMIVGWFMMFNVQYFNYIVELYRGGRVLLEEETRVPGENH